MKRALAVAVMITGILMSLNVNADNVKVDGVTYTCENRCVPVIINGVIFIKDCYGGKVTAKYEMMP